jgi:hypothetical protein
MDGKFQEILTISDNQAKHQLQDLVSGPSKPQKPLSATWKKLKEKVAAFVSWLDRQLIDVAEANTLAFTHGYGLVPLEAGM